MVDASLAIIPVDTPPVQLQPSPPPPANDSGLSVGEVGAIAGGASGGVLVVGLGLLLWLRARKMKYEVRGGCHSGGAGRPCVAKYAAAFEPFPDISCPPPL